jgi:hypothetical protein
MASTNHRFEIKQDVEIRVVRDCWSGRWERRLIDGSIVVSTITGLTEVEALREALDLAAWLLACDV